jgi:hypothetical protein
LLRAENPRLPICFGPPLVTTSVYFISCKNCISSSLSDQKTYQNLLPQNYHYASTLYSPYIVLQKETSIKYIPLPASSKCSYLVDNRRTFVAAHLPFSQHLNSITWVQCSELQACAVAAEPLHHTSSGALVRFIQKDRRSTQLPSGGVHSDLLCKHGTAVAGGGYC